VATEAEGRVHGGVASSWLERGKDLRDENRDVAARGRLAGGEHLRALPGEARGIVLLVFFRERARMRAAVARTPPRLSGVRRPLRHRGRKSAFPIAWGSVTPSH
jgi:hypothetical protein